MSDDGNPRRRDFLRTGSALGASGLVYEGLGGRLLDSAAARTRRCGGQLRDIEHIVVLMQENRSFDEYFGTFPGVRGFDDRRDRQAFAQPGYFARVTEGLSPALSRGWP